MWEDNTGVIVDVLNHSARKMIVILWFLLTLKGDLQRMKKQLKNCQIYAETHTSEAFLVKPRFHGFYINTREQG